MRSARWRRVVRFLALALVVWLGADALSHGNCTHDLISFARGSSEVGDTSRPHSPTPGRDDVNHCSCHWQYLPTAVPSFAALQHVSPVAIVTPHIVSPLLERNLERPPQALA